MQLGSARAKTNQGRAHAREFTAAAGEWLLSLPRQYAPIKQRTEPWGEDGLEAVIYQIVDSGLRAPQNVTLALGDSVACFRAALDHIAWALVTAAGDPKNPRSVYFPVALTREKFLEEVPRKLPGVDPVARFIVERFQPYTHGEGAPTHPFRMLDDWAQEDKHRQLPVAAGWSQHMDFHTLEDYENFTPTRQEMNPDPLPLAPGTDLVRVIGRRKDPTKEPGVKMLWQGSMSIRNTDGVLIDEALGIFESTIRTLIAELEAAL